MYTTMKVFHALIIILTVSTASLSIGCAPSKQQRSKELVREFNAKQEQVSAVNQLLADQYRVLLYEPDPRFSMGDYIKGYNWGQTKDTDRASIKVLLNGQAQRIARIIEIAKIASDRDMHLAGPISDLIKVQIYADQYMKAMETYEKGLQPPPKKPPRKKPRQDEERTQQNNPATVKLNSKSKGSAVRSS